MPKGNSGRVRFTWRVSQYKQATKQSLMIRATKAGLLLRNEHRKNLNTPYPPASTPGEHPRRRSGRLRDGVLFRQTVQGKGGKFPGSIRVEVLETTYYWVWLYASGRLRLQETLSQHKNRISRVMTTGKLD